MRYEIHITTHDDRTDEEVADAILAVLPNNAALSIRAIPDEPDSGAPME